MAARKSRECKEGFVYIQEYSWLGMCCGVFAPSWKRKYARLSSEKITFSESQKSPELSCYYLKGADVSISELIGHNGKHNCILIAKRGKNFIFSVETSDDLRTWMLAMASIIETLDKESSYFNF